MEIPDAFKKYDFYHCVELSPGVVTPGWKAAVPLQAPVLQLINEHDLTNKRVLDVGCRDGLFSFAAEKRGGIVYGIDNDLSKPAVEFLIPFLKSSVTMKQINVYDLKIDLEERFDFVIFSGILYHLRFPLLGIQRIADAMKNGGEMILETAILLTHHKYPFIYCPKPIDSPFDPTSVTFFNHLSLLAALESLGFTDIKCRSVIARVDGQLQRSNSWDSFLAERPVLAASDDIIIGRGTYTCRRQDTGQSALTNYWFGFHNRHSDWKSRDSDFSQGKQ